MVNTSLLSQEELHIYLDHSQILFSYPINRNTTAIQSMLLHKGTNPAKHLEDPALRKQNLICKPEKPKTSGCTHHSERPSYTSIRFLTPSYSRTQSVWKAALT